MTVSANQIKNELENTYDIPFYVREEKMNGEPCFYMGPDNEGEEFFYIRVSFRNSIRMTAEFFPEKYGGVFIRSMAGRSEESKESFVQFAHLMQDKGAKVTIAIDHTPVLIDAFKTYSGMWSSLSIKATKVPIAENEKFSYSQIAGEWGSLMIGMVLSMADIVLVDEIESIQPTGKAEGNKYKVTSNRYERSRINRKLCLERQGYNCCVCGMNFENKYGSVGHHFIHVHHVIPVSQLGDGYIIDPTKDLVPVCPNCHAMLHRKDPPYLPDELRMMMHSRYHLDENAQRVAESFHQHAPYNFE